MSLMGTVRYGRWFWSFVFGRSFWSYLFFSVPVLRTPLVLFVGLVRSFFWLVRLVRVGCSLSQK